MNIGVAKERAAGEQRIALGPDSIAKLVKGGAAVLVERGAGTAAGFPDAVLEKAGATLVDDAAALYAGSAIVLRVQPPTLDETKLLPEGSVLISSIPAATSGELVKALAARRVTALALERVPRITRAQSMDVLSSQSTVVGLQGGAHRRRGAAASSCRCSRPRPARSRPRKAFVIGAGVAGLQAIATARRLGARRLGVRRAAGGARAGDEPRRHLRRRRARERRRPRTRAATRARRARTSSERTLDAIARTSEGHGPGDHDGAHSRAAGAGADHRGDGRRRCSPGSVIVDLAAETGGNCALTKPGETVTVNGVTIIGAAQPAQRPCRFHASQMFSRNMLDAAAAPDRRTSRSRSTSPTRSPARWS